MAATRYTVKLKCRPFYPWEKPNGEYVYDNDSLLRKAWDNYVSEMNRSWEPKPTGPPYVSIEHMNNGLKEFGGRVGKEESRFGTGGWMTDWFREVQFKEGEGLSYFILKYGH